MYLLFMILYLLYSNIIYYFSNIKLYLYLLSIKIENIYINNIIKLFIINYNKLY